MRPETNIRTSGIQTEKIYSRLNNLEEELLVDVLGKIDAGLGIPFEVTPTEPFSPIVLISSGVYLLPGGRRVTSIRNGTIPNVGAGEIRFDLGTISVGGNPTFTMPTLSADQYVKALIQFHFGTQSFDVTFGLPGASQAAAGIPAALDNYQSICFLELHSTPGGVGEFDNILPTDIVSISSSSIEVNPTEELQTVVGSPQTVFTLSTIGIPPLPSKFQVFRNGVLQVGNYTVDSVTQLTFSSPIAVNSVMLFRAG